MFCKCCGFEIIRSSHRVKSGFVCDRCWNDPNLFFPEKLLSDEGKLDFRCILQEKASDLGSIRIPVIKLRQKNIVLYVGKMKARVVLLLYGISVFEEDTLNGYQREIYENEVADLYEYITECPIAVIPGLFISLREGANFNAISPESSLIGKGDVGMLEIPMRRGAIWIIDGQHRIGSFDRVLSEIGHLQNENSSEGSTFSELMDYELPIIFVDSQEIVTKLNGINKRPITPVDIERTIFYIINRTQKRIPPSLKDTLQYCIKKSGVDGIPIIEREEWRTIATSITIRMNQSEDSPLRRKINVSGTRGRNEPIRLNSFVSSLRPLFFNGDFVELEFDQKMEFLLTYWRAVEEMNEKAFREETCRDYLILKAIGIYSLNSLGSDYLECCKIRDCNPVNQDHIRTFLGPIKNFDWNRSTSPFAHFSGMSGVKKIHGILLEEINGRNKLA